MKTQWKADIVEVSKDDIWGASRPIGEVVE